MEKDRNWQNKVGQKLDALGNSFMQITHAQVNEDPKTHWSKKFHSQHRLYNAAGMFGCFLIGSSLRDTLRGFDEKGREINREKIPEPLRFLHGALAHNPHSDKMDDRWKKVICQIIPATFGATGAILGSVFFFRNNTEYDQRAANIAKHARDDQNTGMGLGQVNDASTHALTWPFRILAGIFATFSAASGLTVLYGIFLNSAFSFATNRQMFVGFGDVFGFKGPTTLHGPVQALDKRVIKETEQYVTRWMKNGGEIPAQEREELQNRLMNEVIAPLFPKLKKEDEQKLRDGVTKMFDDAIATATAKNDTPEAMAKRASGFLSKLFRDKTPSELKAETDPFKSAVHYLQHIYGLSLESLKKDYGVLLPAAAPEKTTYRLTEPFIDTMRKYFGMSNEQLKEAAVTSPDGLTNFSKMLYSAFGGDKTMKAMVSAWHRRVDNYPPAQGGR